MKIAFIHKPNIKFFNPDFFSPYFYNFFYRALPRNSRIDYTILPRKTVDVDELNQYDVVMLFALHDKLGYIPVPRETKAMVIANAYDSQYINDAYMANAEQCGCKHFFYHHCPKWFYKFAPEQWKYCQVQMVLEPDDYKKIVPFEKRNKRKVLLTGKMTESEYYFTRRILWKKAKQHVKYVPRHEMFERDKYLFLLNGFRASAAACSITTVNKYVESLAAGCLTFAECNDKNGWECMGLRDGANCIAINKSNCIDKVKEYIADVDNPKYADIAAAGRRHAMENLSNDVMVDRLIDWIEKQ